MSIAFRSSMGAYKAALAVLLALATPLYGGITFEPGPGNTSTEPGYGRVVFTPFVAAPPPAGNSDDFTNSDDTLLATHNANWVSLTGTYVVTSCEIISNTARATGAFHLCGAAYNASTSDTSQIVVKAYSDNNVSKRVCVRSNPGTAEGYCAVFGDPSGGNWTSINITKNGSWLDGGAGSYAQASDHTLKITASGTTSVTLTVYVNGGQARQYVDSSSAIASGKPGFRMEGNGDATVTGMDDWQDY